MVKDSKLRFSVKQIQLAARVGLELGSSGLQLQHSNRSATPPTPLLLLPPLLLLLLLLLLIVLRN